MLATVWIGLGAALWAAFGLEWIGRAVLLVISPLWFIAVYLVLIALIPLWFALCRRFGLLRAAGMSFGKCCRSCQSHGNPLIFAK